MAHNSVGFSRETMPKRILILLFAFTVCHANSLATDTSTGVVCEKRPTNFHPCLGSPKFLNSEGYPSCERTKTQCEHIQCFFKQSGWLDWNDKVNKTKVAKYFDQFATLNPKWTQTVTQLKAACLGKTDLPPQGVPLNCAPYDIIHCVEINFLKHAPSSQWQTAPECREAQTFLANCPFCPADCYPPLVPNDGGVACNACRGIA